MFEAGHGDLFTILSIIQNLQACLESYLICFLYYLRVHEQNDTMHDKNAFTKIT